MGLLMFLQVCATVLFLARARPSREIIRKVTHEGSVSKRTDYSDGGHDDLLTKKEQNGPVVRRVVDHKGGISEQSTAHSVDAMSVHAIAMGKIHKNIQTVDLPSDSLETPGHYQSGASKPTVVGSIGHSLNLVVKDGESKTTSPVNVALGVGIVFLFGILVVGVIWSMSVSARGGVTMSTLGHHFQKPPAYVDASEDEIDDGWEDACERPAAASLRTGLLWKLRGRYCQELVEWMRVYSGFTHVERIAIPVCSKDKSSDTESKYVDLEAWDQRFFKLEYDKNELILSYASVLRDMKFKSIKIDSVDMAILEIPVRATDASSEKKQLETELYLRNLPNEAKSDMPDSLYVFAVRGKVADSSMQTSMPRASTADNTESPSMRSIFLGTDNADIAELWVTQMLNRFESSQQLGAAWQATGAWERRKGSKPDRNSRGQRVASKQDRSLSPKGRNPSKGQLRAGTKENRPLSPRVSFDETG